MNFPLVIPVAVFHGEEEAVGMLTELKRGGLPVAEITFRTSYAPEAISLCRERFPEFYVGAGSVLDGKQAQLALERGAEFLVSPGFSEEVAALCEKRGIPYLPGAVTPTEIMRARESGFSPLSSSPHSKERVHGGSDRKLFRRGRTSL